MQAKACDRLTEFSITLIKKITIIDVNVLVYAHREDAADHLRFRKWLEAQVGAAEAFGVSGSFPLVSPPVFPLLPAPTPDDLSHHSPFSSPTSSRRESVLVIFPSFSHANRGVSSDAFCPRWRSNQLQWIPPTGTSVVSRAFDGVIRSESIGFLLLIDTRRFRLGMTELRYTRPPRDSLRISR